MSELPSTIHTNASHAWETKTELVLRTDFGLTDFWVIIPAEAENAGHASPITFWEPSREDFEAHIKNPELLARLSRLLEIERGK